MTVPPLPTFVPQDEWYTLTTGNLNPSVAGTVPNITYLRPSSTPQGDVDGLTGALDGMILYLAGLSSQLDGGQKFLMWDESSLQADDGVNVFNPWVDTSTTGRWVATQTSGAGPGVTTSNQTISAGGTSDIAPAATQFINVYVGGRSVAGATTLNLPASTFQGQAITVKDANGDVGTDNIIVVAASIDGDTSSTLTFDYQSRTFTWNGVEWGAQ